MNRFLRALVLSVTLAPIASFGAVENSDASNALKKLEKGNERYVTSATFCHEDWSVKRAAVVESQAPFAVIVGCSDSRLPPEIIFDQTLGSLFVIRLAGNIVDEFAIGSIEYGVAVLGAKVVMVLGHSNCGAVEAAVKGLKVDNHIQGILSAIQPAVVSAKVDSGNILEKAIKANAKNVQQKLIASRPVLAQLVQEGKVRIVAAYYDLASGKVQVLD